MSHDWIDISVPIDSDTPVWPDDPEFEREEILSLEDDGVRVSRMSMSIHTGTHIDAPAHYIEDGLTIESMPFETMIGPCVVAKIPGVQRIGPELLRQFELYEAERLLLKTDNSKRNRMHRREFDEDFCHLTAEGAAYLARHHLRCIGIDYLSIGGGADMVETHRTLLDSGVWILEGLDLRAVEPGEYELHCLPLRISGAEAAPARALLRRPSGQSTPDFIEDAVEWSSRVG